ncbi:MAG: BamA/TamA family outer membrane protein [Bacteroidota bacterium]
MLILFSLIIRDFETKAANADSTILIGRIIIEGNKITRKNIILRELTFNEGDSVRKSEILSLVKKNRENLLNTSLFNYVTVVFEDSSSDYTVVRITLEERWYIWPYPILEHADRNFSNFLHDHDWNRINYGGFLQLNNVTGRNEVLKLKARYGFKEQLAIGYGNPNIDRKHNHGIEIWLSHFRQKKVAANTVDNRLFYISSNNEYLKEYTVFDVKYSYRQQHSIYHFLSCDYYFSDAADTIIAFNPGYYGNGNSDLKYSAFTYKLIYDLRDLQYYPTNGTYLEMGLKRLGFANTPAVDCWQIYADARKYWNPYGDFYWSFRLKGITTTGSNAAYVTGGALGYEDFLRGYEYYVIDGNNYVIASQMLRWNMIPEKIMNAGFIPSSRFNKVHYTIYLSIFADAGFVNDRESIAVNNSMAGDFLYSWGAGLDFVTYYDKMLRLEYSVNKLGIGGLYLHFQTYF